GAGQHLVYCITFEGFGVSTSGLGHEHNSWVGIIHLKSVSIEAGPDHVAAEGKKGVDIFNL
ncbi:hypothetical protein, partial [Silvimonas sp.]|uniref:hypothetical protein n=1 Tax=Silvimonas sp. TaxID=2650811 RepID=UPI00284CA610